MKIKRLYFSFKEKVKDYFKIGKKEFTPEQKDYLLSGISQNILDNYRIIYSPEKLIFNANKKGTKIKRTLENKLESLEINFSEGKETQGKDGLKYLVNLKNELKQKHQKNMQLIKLNHLRRLNEIYSKVVETYTSGMNELRNVLIEKFLDGKVKINFC